MATRYKQLSLDFLDTLPSPELNNEQSITEYGFGNKLALKDKAFHNWYRFVLSYPPHLVRHYFDDFKLSAGKVVLDPFCGTGTTLVEGRLNHLETIGVEANPIAHFASSVKVDWDIDPDDLLATANAIAQEAFEIFKVQGIEDTIPIQLRRSKVKLQTLSEEEEKILLGDSISPLPLHKSLVLRDLLTHYQTERYYQHLRLALAKTLVFGVSNLHFGPEVGVERPKYDAPVVSIWLTEVRLISEDLRKVRSESYPKSKVLLADSRNISSLIEPASVDAVITSPLIRTRRTIPERRASNRLFWVIFTIKRN